MSASEQTSASKREPGYYWVNSDFKKEFRPRYWNGSLWFVGMDVYVGDEFWQEIDERPIERGQPDELSKAQARIRELEATLIELRRVLDDGCSNCREFREEFRAELDKVKVLPQQP